MSKIAVTGGAGLIGSYLVDQLVDAGEQVVVVDDFSKGKKENLSHVIGRCEVVEGDLEDEGFAEKALSGLDTVYHLASRAYGIGYSVANHLDMLEHNERITNNVLRAVRKNQIGKLLVTSSSCVHRDDTSDTVAELPLFDGEPEMVNWGYGWAKRFLEQKALMYARETGVKLTIVRPFNIYGERYNWVGSKSQAIPMLVKRVLDGNDPVVIWGSGNQRRNYLHARDCATLMRHFLEVGYTSGPVNIGLRETITMNGLVEAICRAAGVSPALEHDLTKPEGRFVKSSDETLLRSLLPDFEPSVSIQEGMALMVGWYRKTFIE
ncbi:MULTISPECIES: NAD-dependent epimerase/dehydratase family protein [Thalassospira]|uniref:NAD-dependent epimerase/dehydratase domain-containing protein n=1 Tax=Thalassospira lohafexi TaxID=744227 RepID=A0A2N3LBF9_9PROT|nr:MULTISPECIES: NAD-dependent epimerase/dehydratase family protein [Thalassospira]PKR60060.1 hypothetical protein COO92_01420 [Thalassospira lohafexi]RCK30560.1 hypothetical protein TH1_01135 [Thalassospira lucentensis MCCC 1A00383 = DSM 14000]|tara:strand:- start:5870 stop:6832 length:963 start_codon:yes stop_codon:yes gene_type:complete